MGRSNQLHLSFLLLAFAAFAAFVPSRTAAFTVPLPCRSLATSTTTGMHHGHSMMPIDDIGSLTTAVVEVFDGSSIVDPVVVSDVFWSNLQGKMVSFIIGQILAAAAFAAIMSFGASQVSQLGDFVSKQVFSAGAGINSNSNANRANNVSPATGKPFVRADQTRVVAPDFGKLLVCLAIDVLGSSSEILPIVGEFTDILYAPIAASLLRSLYGSNVIFALEFAEEILPFTDIIPLATLCWVVDTFFADSDLARTLQLGSYRTDLEDAIDVSANDTTSTTSSTKLVDVDASRGEKKL